ncbi:unnamed protein product [Parnassius apollo]|uniref:(apollo) hypothetical protein n=1 Tax=Parnassius apollo TaxID=110799 RepID=A0A8S3WNT2_PARAO|nr:unnamed protein product [Parnassius apollo]
MWMFFIATAQPHNRRSYDSSYPTYYSKLDSPREVQPSDIICDGRARTRAGAQLAEENYDSNNQLQAAESAERVESTETITLPHYCKAPDTHFSKL